VKRERFAIVTTWLRFTVASSKDRTPESVARRQAA
jgi:hypothetical protein